MRVFYCVELSRVASFRFVRIFRRHPFIVALFYRRFVMANDDSSQSNVLEVSQLLILQAERMKSLKNVLNTFRMDCGKQNVRKTKSYYDARLRKIDTAYKEFQEDHKLLLFSADSDDDYFKNDSSSQFEEAYLEVYCALVDHRVV